jgi:hypothetical protein
MDRRRLSACANFVGYIDVMGHINQPNVSIELNIYIYIFNAQCQHQTADKFELLFN